MSTSSPTPRQTQPPPAPGRRERRKQELRERILAAARELFAKQGFEATTVDEIAERADVAPATFFNHFQSKQALLGRMTGEVLEVLELLTKQHLEREGSSAQKLHRFIASAADALSAHRVIARDVLLEMMRSESTPDRPNPHLARLHDPFEALLRQGQENGEFRADHEAAFLAQMAVGMLNSALTNWFADPDYPVEQGLLDATDFVLDTLAAARANDSETRVPASPRT